VAGYMHAAKFRHVLMRLTCFVVADIGSLKASTKKNIGDCANVIVLAIVVL